MPRRMEQALAYEPLAVVYQQPSATGNGLEAPSAAVHGLETTKAAGNGLEAPPAAGHGLEALPAAGIKIKATSAAGYEAEVSSAAGHEVEALANAGNEAEALSAAGHKIKATSAAGHKIEATSAAGYEAEALSTASHRAEASSAAGQKAKVQAGANHGAEARSDAGHLAEALSALVPSAVGQTLPSRDPCDHIPTVASADCSPNNHQGLQHLTSQDVQSLSLEFLRDGEEGDLERILGELAALQSSIASLRLGPAMSEIEIGQPAEVEQDKKRGCEAGGGEEAAATITTRPPPHSSASPPRQRSQSAPSPRGERTEHADSTAPPPPPQVGERSAPRRIAEKQITRHHLEDDSKVFVKVFCEDGSTKSFHAPRGNSVFWLRQQMVAKCRPAVPSLAWSILEQLPALHLERELEEDEKIADILEAWGPRTTENRLVFSSRPGRLDLFRRPEKYLAATRGPAPSLRRSKLLKEFFIDSSSSSLSIEGSLWLKLEGKKVWKKHAFSLRSSGIYYVTNDRKFHRKSQLLASCLVSLTPGSYCYFYLGVGWRQKHKAPTDFGFALSGGQPPHKDKLIYLCAETEDSRREWQTGLRVAQAKEQLWANFHRLLLDLKEQQLRGIVPSPALGNQQVLDPVEPAHLSSAKTSNKSCWDKAISSPSPESRSWDSGVCSISEASSENSGSQSTGATFPTLQQHHLGCKNAGSGLLHTPMASTFSPLPNESFLDGGSTQKAITSTASGHLQRSTSVASCQQVPNFPPDSWLVGGPPSHTLNSSPSLLSLPPSRLQSDSACLSDEGPNPGRDEYFHPRHTDQANTSIQPSQRTRTDHQQELLTRIPNELPSLPLLCLQEEKANYSANQRYQQAQLVLKSSLKHSGAGLERGYDSPRGLKKITFDEGARRQLEDTPSPPPLPSPMISTRAHGEHLLAKGRRSSTGSIPQVDKNVLKEDFLANLQRVVSSKLAISEHHPAGGSMSAGSTYSERDVSTWILQSLRHQRRQDALMLPLPPPPLPPLEQTLTNNLPQGDQSPKEPKRLPANSGSGAKIGIFSQERRSSAGGKTTSFPQYSSGFLPQPSARGGDEGGQRKEWSTGSQYPQQPLECSTLSSKPWPLPPAIYSSNPRQADGWLLPTSPENGENIPIAPVQQQRNVYQSNHFPVIPSYTPLPPILNQFGGTPLSEPRQEGAPLPLNAGASPGRTWTHRQGCLLQRSQSAHTPAAMRGAEPHRPFIDDQAAQMAAERLSLSGRDVGWPPPPARRGPPPPPPQRSSKTQLSSLCQPTMWNLWIVGD